MQWEILKQSLKQSIKYILLFISILTITYIIFFIINKYPISYYSYILGNLNLNNHYSVLLFLFNISFIIFLSIKYILFDIKEIPYNIIQRESNKSWISKKIIFLNLLTILTKIFIYLYFFIINKISSNNIYLPINYYIYDIYLNIIISFVALNLLIVSNKIPLLSIIFSLILLINNEYLFSVLTFLISTILVIMFYYYKKK